MKRNLHISLIAALLISVANFVMYGQRSVPDRSSKEITLSEKKYAQKDSITIYTNDINSKARKNFLKMYKNVTGENWNELPDGMRVKFILNGIQHWVDYSKNGEWLETIRFYYEKELSPEIRYLVKNDYYNYSIKWVKEIEKPRDIRTYIVHLEGQKDWINLRVHDGEMEEWQKFFK
jgi:hypothetical protein